MLHHPAPNRPIAHVQFRAGAIFASDGCNYGYGRYAADGGRKIHISAVPFILRACAGSHSSKDQPCFFRALSPAVAVGQAGEMGPVITACSAPD